MNVNVLVYKISVNITVVHNVINRPTNVFVYFHSPSTDETNVMNKNDVDSVNILSHNKPVGLKV